MNMMDQYTTEELQQELERRNTIKRKHDRPSVVPNLDVSPLIKLCEDYVDFIDSDDYYEDNDYKHYIYEEALRTIYGNNFWEWYRRVTP